jgi:hypothetical protein
MNNSTIYFLKIARKICSKLQRFDQSEKLGLAIDFSEQAASDLIKAKLIADEPCMICRFGTNELAVVVQYLDIHRKPKFPLEKSINYILGNSGKFWWDEYIRASMRDLSGFFPSTDQLLESFSRRMLREVENIDVLGSWVKQEEVVSDLLKNALRVRLQDLEPYYHLNPWTEALEGKVILVIHPFEKSIQMQYKKRKLLFEDQRFLPEFELKTFKSIQSIGEENAGFKTWFDALDWMCEKINDIEFDIAIIGAGAYGLPLASHIKNLGKKSVHLGGATQILFGIKGKRWDSHPFIKELYNQHWVRPLPSEMPKNYQSVEGGCYW